MVLETAGGKTFRAATFSTSGAVTGLIDEKGVLSVKTWEGQADKEVSTGWSLPAETLATNSDGTIVVAANSVGQIGLWRSNDLMENIAIWPRKFAVSSITFDPPGQRV